MSDQNFIDYVKIFLKSGDGGKGARHFRREKHVPDGGPDGGDGGRGGHIIIRGNVQLWTLLHLKYRKHIKASSGVNGSSAKCKGADGIDEYVDVPPGTIVYDAETREKLCEITQDGEEFILISGGRGGLGNQHFRTSTNQAPEYAQTGEAGEEFWVIAELKVLADVGFVGFPNAGKSSLLRQISAATPKVADYAFTTLVPHLGVVGLDNFRSFIVADIPGIIEGASEGKGIGFRFLKHIERNSILLFVISAESKNIATDYFTLLAELEKFNPELINKNKLLAVSKLDLLDDELSEQLKLELPKGVDYVFFSSQNQKGLGKLKEMLWEKLKK